MTFCCGSGPGSGSPDSCLWIMDPDPAIFVTDLQDANKKLIWKKVFLLITFWRYIYIFFKDKKSKSSRNQGFSCYFCLVIEGSGSIPLTNGSGPDPGRPKSKGSDGSGSRFGSDPQHCYKHTCRKVPLQVRFIDGDILLWCLYAEVN